MHQSQIKTKKSICSFFRRKKLWPKIEKKWKSHKRLKTDPSYHFMYGKSQERPKQPQTLFVKNWFYWEDGYGPVARYFHTNICVRTIYGIDNSSKNKEKIVINELLWKNTFCMFDLSLYSYRSRNVIIFTLLFFFFHASLSN